MAADLLDGRTALVTGATSGIGAGIARRFAAAGARVVLSGRDRTRAASLAHELSAPLALGDVSVSEEATSVVERAAEALDGLDIVVNAAGAITRGAATATTDDDWRLNMAVNADGVFYVSRAAVISMSRYSGSNGANRAIVNIASNVGLVGSPGLAAYCASKGAVVGLTRAMALDHAADGIRINALCPGAVDTPMLFSGHEATGLKPDEVVTANESSIPQGRIATVDEVADVALFLASDLASHITGVALAVDGGYLAQ